MAAQTVAVERNLGKCLRHGINLQEGTSLKDAVNKKCGEIFDGTHILSLLNVLSRKYYLPYVWLGLEYLET